MVNLCNRVIEYSFYFLFLLVPLAFTDKTSELFELNKMWLVWVLTIIIAAAWFVKMVLQRRILFQRTPLDIPIGLFLLSQIVSTIFSLDFHISLWGYYSRFNGGLFSIISYILLYYAFLSNFSFSEGWRTRGTPIEHPQGAQRLRMSDGGKVRQDPEHSGPAIAIVKRLLSLSLISGLIVALWGLPSHFGYDPTCLIFRGTLDVSCWTADFIPTIRIFSTLGQPDWLAAYLAILIPISIIMFIKFIKNLPLSIFYFLLSALFYVDILYTRARSGIFGVWIALLFFAALYYWVSGKPKLSISYEKLKSPLAVLIFGLLILTFIIGTPINQLNKFTLQGIGSYFQKTATTEIMKQTETQKDKTPAQSLESGGTDSAIIRLNVWTGAINAWKANPIFGTGVETFAFAYYKYKPAGQNLTSEWNFLYNKAHNEYLNYLATTGLFGLGSYLLMIGSFLFLAIKKISNFKFLISNQIPNSPLRSEASKSQLGQLDPPVGGRNLVLALLAGYISILVTNFFGFSVVIVNIYLFMIPAFVFVLGGMIKPKESVRQLTDKNYESTAVEISLYQWAFISFIIFTSLFMIQSLCRFWLADIHYALGYNLDRAGEYQKGYESLHKAVKLRGDEPVFKDELSINAAIIAAGLIAKIDQGKTNQDQTLTIASSLTQEAINTSNEIISKSPNNAVFWKTRVRLFHSLSQVDSRYLPRALDGIQKASLIAPNDANIWYNLGVLYGQNNNIAKGIEALEKTVQLKPDYRDAHYALGLFYHQKALDKDGKVTDSALQKKAIAQMQYILLHIVSQDAGALDSLKTWKQ